jgi:hypothetical protein
LEWRGVLEGVVALSETRVFRLCSVLQGWPMLEAEVALAGVFQLCALLVVGSCPTVGAKCWNSLSVARRPTKVNSDDNRVTC